MKLNELRDNKYARPTSKRVGRGIGSGKGKTCGSGHKGQKARTGVAINGFEGGQNPIYRRLPKRGFNNPSRKNVQTINLTALQKAIEKGTIQVKQNVTKEALKEAGLIAKINDPVKLLGIGELTQPVNITVDMASKSVIKKLEKSKSTLNVATATKG